MGPSKAQIILCMINIFTVHVKLLWTTLSTEENLWLRSYWTDPQADLHVLHQWFSRFSCNAHFYYETWCKLDNVVILWVLNNHTTLQLRDNATNFLEIMQANPTWKAGLPLRQCFQVMKLFKKRFKVLKTCFFLVQVFNPVAPKMAKNHWSFDHSKYNTVSV